MSRAGAELETQTNPLVFYQYVATSEELRDAATKALMLLDDHEIESSMCLNVYQAMLNAERNIITSGRKLDPEEERLVKKLILDRKRIGLGLSNEGCQKIKELRKELACIENVFNVSLFQVW